MMTATRLTMTMRSTAMTLRAPPPSIRMLSPSAPRRILRYAMLVKDRAGAIELRLAANIDQLCTNLPSATAWARTRDAEAGLTLSAKLDRPRPAAALQPAGLRSALVADAAFRCSPFRRVTRVLITAFEAVAGDLQEQRTRFNKFVDLWGFAATEKRGVLPLRATRICQQTSG
ncbi:MAG: hypothetical protein BGP05_14510 [Rhizobiales bacterium 62-47]|nr:MAG: hypothetical protein BGP05_14510 [Rhizobiales bacterium 62-47]